MDIERDRAEADKRYMAILKELILKEIPDSYAVFLFGSRARGEKKKAPDVDIGILGSARFPLEMKSRIYALIDASIVPFRVDLVDFYQIDPEFKQIAMKDIDIWRCPQTIKLD